MEPIKSSNILIDQPVQWRSFLKKREFYRDVAGIARMALTFLDQSQMGSENITSGINLLKLCGPLSIRPDTSDIREQFGLVRDAIKFRHIGISAQNLTKLSTRFLTILIALTTFGSGAVALRGGSYSLPLIFTTVKEVLSDLLVIRAYRNSHYLDAQLKDKSDSEVLTWIRRQVDVTTEEETASTPKANASGANPSGPGVVNALKGSLINQKKQWLREAMGDQALNIALAEREDGHTKALVVNDIKQQVKLKKAANLCGLINSIITLSAVMCLYRGGEIKKYAYLLYGVSGVISLPDAKLHRKVAQYQ